MEQDQPTYRQPSPQEAIEYVIAAQGNTKLAAARLNAICNPQRNKDYELTEARLLTIIAQDPNSLNTLTVQIKLLTVMQATDAFRLTHQAFLASLGELTAPAIARTYINMLSTMTTLSEMSTPTTDPYDAVMRSLPSEVAAAVQELIAPAQDTKSSAALPNNNIDLPQIINPAPPKPPVTSQTPTPLVPAKPVPQDSDSTSNDA